MYHRCPLCYFQEQYFKALQGDLFLQHKTHTKTLKMYDKICEIFDSKTAVWGGVMPGGGSYCAGVGSKMSKINEKR